jgi:hypothetical protein
VPFDLTLATQFFAMMKPEQQMEFLARMYNLPPQNPFAPSLLNSVNTPAPQQFPAHPTHLPPTSSAQRRPDVSNNRFPGPVRGDIARRIDRLAGEYGVKNLQIAELNYFSSDLEPRESGTQTQCGNCGRYLVGYTGVCPCGAEF